MSFKDSFKAEAKSWLDALLKASAIVVVLGLPALIIYVLIPGSHYWNWAWIVQMFLVILGTLVIAASLLMFILAYINAVLSAILRNGEYKKSLSRIAYSVFILGIGVGINYMFLWIPYYR